MKKNILKGSKDIINDKINKSKYDINITNKNLLYGSSSPYNLSCKSITDQIDNIINNCINILSAKIPSNEIKQIYQKYNSEFLNTVIGYYNFKNALTNLSDSNVSDKEYEIAIKYINQFLNTLQTKFDISKQLSEILIILCYVDIFKKSFNNFSEGNFASSINKQYLVLLLDKLSVLKNIFKNKELEIIFSLLSGLYNLLNTLSNYVINYRNNTNIIKSLNSVSYSDIISNNTQQSNINNILESSQAKTNALITKLKNGELSQDELNKIFCNDQTIPSFLLTSENVCEKIPFLDNKNNDSSLSYYETPNRYIIKFDNIDNIKLDVSINQLVSKNQKIFSINSNGLLYNGVAPLSGTVLNVKHNEILFETTDIPNDSYQQTIDLKNTLNDIINKQYLKISAIEAIRYFYIWTIFPYLLNQTKDSDYNSSAWTILNNKIDINKIVLDDNGSIQHQPIKNALFGWNKVINDTYESRFLSTMDNDKKKGEQIANSYNNSNFDNIEINDNSARNKLNDINNWNAILLNDIYYLVNNSKKIIPTVHNLNQSDFDMVNFYSIFLSNIGNKINNYNDNNTVYKLYQLISNRIEFLITNYGYSNETFQNIIYNIIKNNTDISNSFVNYSLKLDNISKIVSYISKYIDKSKDIKTQLTNLLNGICSNIINKDNVKETINTISDMFVIYFKMFSSSKPYIYKNVSDMKKICLNEWKILQDEFEQYIKYTLYDINNDIASIENQIINITDYYEEYIDNIKYYVYYVNNDIIDSKIKENIDSNLLSDQSTSNDPNIYSYKYWLRYFGIVNMFNLIPTNWQTGLYILGPIKLPVVYIPIKVFKIDGYGVIVLGLSICGIAILPFTMIINTSNQWLPFIPDITTSLKEQIYSLYEKGVELPVTNIKNELSYSIKLSIEKELKPLYKEIESLKEEIIYLKNINININILKNKLVTDNLFNVLKTRYENLLPIFDFNNYKELIISYFKKLQETGIINKNIDINIDYEILLNKMKNQIIIFLNAYNIIPVVSESNIKLIKQKLQNDIDTKTNTLKKLETNYNKILTQNKKRDLVINNDIQDDSDNLIIKANKTKQISKETKQSVDLLISQIDLLWQSMSLMSVKPDSMAFGWSMKRPTNIINLIQDELLENQVSFLSDFINNTLEESNTYIESIKHKFNQTEFNNNIKELKINKYINLQISDFYNQEQINKNINILISTAHLLSMKDRLPSYNRLNFVNIPFLFFCFTVLSPKSTNLMGLI